MLYFKQMVRVAERLGLHLNIGATAGSIFLDTSSIDDNDKLKSAIYEYACAIRHRSDFICTKLSTSFFSDILL